MDKQLLLKDYKKQEDKMCLSQILDKIEFSKMRGKIEYTDFLDMYQISLVESFLRKIKFENSRKSPTLSPRVLELLRIIEDLSKCNKT